MVRGSVLQMATGLVLPLLMTACGSSSSEAESGEQSVSAADVLSSVEQVLNAAEGHAVPEGPIQWPRDSLPTSRYRAESWQLMAVLERQDDRLLSVLQQLDRLSVQPADSLESESTGSLWRYRNVMRGSLHVMGDGEPRRDWQMVQRVALGLAEAESAASSADGAHVRVGGLGLQIRIAMADAGQTDAACPMQWTASLAGELELMAEQQACAEGTAAGPVRVLNSGSLPVSGHFGDHEPVSGTAWIRHAFGELPTTGSPVVFDTALIELQGLGLLRLTRSKRRRGSGPQTLDAAWHGQPGMSGDDLRWEAEWETGDEAGSSASHAIPVRWRLLSAVHGLDVALQPVARDAWIDVPGGRSWRGAVSISGSHEGVGFVEIQPVDSDAELQGSS